LSKKAISAFYRRAPVCCTTPPFFFFTKSESLAKQVVFLLFWSRDTEHILTIVCIVSRKDVFYGYVVYIHYCSINTMCKYTRLLIDYNHFIIQKKEKAKFSVVDFYFIASINTSRVKCNNYVHCLSRKKRKDPAHWQIIHLDNELG
jgi:hypothetical protein